MDSTKKVVKKSYLSYETYTSRPTNNLLLFLVTYGTGTLYINGETYEIKRGSIGFLTPDDRYLFESTPQTESQMWIIEFSSDFILDFIVDPIIDLRTFQVLRQKNGISQLSNVDTITINNAIESLAFEPEETRPLKLFGNRNTLRLLFNLANNNLFDIPLPTLVDEFTRAQEIS